MDCDCGAWRPTRCSDVAMRELDDELILYAADQHRAFALNRSAAAIWQLCDGRATVAQMAEMLGRRYACDARYILPDVQAAVRELEQHRLVAAQP